MTKRLDVWIAAAVLFFGVVAIVAGAGDEGPMPDGGLWNVGAEHGTLQAAPGKVMFRFHSRDLHMVLGPARTGKPVRFKVTLEGAAPGDHHGVDSGPDGSGEIRQPRMYQLVRQKGSINDMINDVTFQIEFLDPSVEVFSFTFG